MIATSPEHAVELLDRAFAQGDLQAVLSFYEDAAVVITEPGKAARGTAELSSFFCPGDAIWFFGKAAADAGHRSRRRGTFLVALDSLCQGRWARRC
jgi:hypothetical protein